MNSSKVYHILNKKVYSFATASHKAQTGLYSTNFEMICQSNFANEFNDKSE